ncbi:peptide ABC transporter ATP-binding protein [Paraoerskovia sediminicola]|uniref:Peptide ABC transporter ATP-binding protein n=1 Tax=Paraoerskovia sediminicola TaxID=1138587 RepID=A0ABM8G003_9CELL|nr:ATP-binding cassette domain-containing protein [Paraoerskovia sediminicola]BDZ41413.1 peptide ABC transporter ATP-binding protein [Paraoerskovia sediminicola]
MSKNAATLRATDLWAGEGMHDVVRGVSLELTTGDAPVGIIGESGVGKSTLVRALLGLLRPSHGTVTWDGRTASKLGRRDKKVFRSRVARVSQNGLVDIDTRDTVARALTRALDTARKAGRASSRTVPELIDLAALEPRHAERKIHSLSGGEKQRLAIAAALAPRPDVLILDEPLSAVDPAMRGEVARRLATVAETEGTALLVVTHDLELVERLCPTVHVLADGEFVASGSLREVFARSEHPSVRGLAEAAPLAAQRFR